MDLKENSENLDGNELGFEEEEQIDEENNRENDAVGINTKKISLKSFSIFNRKFRKENF